MKPISFIFTCFLLISVTGMGFIRDGYNKTQQRQFALSFQHTIGGDKLVLGNLCKNILGENIIIEKFKYYVSNFSVTDNNGQITKLPAQYFLIDEADPLSKNIVLTVPGASIKRICFLIGVDSIKNVSGAQTGALDPLNGMFWTWNSGYIMAKLEGSSDVSASQGHYFTYHIGGFKNGMNTTRMITLELPEKDLTANQIIITAEINQWFKGKSELKITETPVCHSPGALAMRIADNYSTMFSINALR